MTRKDTVEMVARAIAKADGKNPDQRSHNSFAWWRHYVPHARDAIEAIRAPMIGWAYEHYDEGGYTAEAAFNAVCGEQPRGTP